MQEMDKSSNKESSLKFLSMFFTLNLFKNRINNSCQRQRPLLTTVDVELQVFIVEKFQALPGIKPRTS